jgi:hypothetical protein
MTKAYLTQKLSDQSLPAGLVQLYRSTLARLNGETVEDQKKPTPTPKEALIAALSSDRLPAERVPVYERELVGLLKSEGQDAVIAALGGALHEKVTPVFQRALVEMLAPVVA